MEKDRVPAAYIKPQASPPVGQVNAVFAALGGLIATAAALGIGRFVYTPILPPMLEALRLSKSEAGLIASANFVGYLIGAFLAAMPRLPGSWGLWLLGSLAISAVSTAGMGLAHTLPAFLILRFVGGAASAFVLILASTVVLDLWLRPDATNYLPFISLASVRALRFQPRSWPPCSTSAKAGGRCGSRAVCSHLRPCSQQRCFYRASLARQRRSGNKRAVSRVPACNVSS